MKRNEYRMTGLVVLRFDEYVRAFEAWKLAHGYTYAQMHQIMGKHVSARTMSRHVQENVAFNEYELRWVKRHTGISEQYLTVDPVELRRVWSVRLMEGCSYERRKERILLSSSNDPSSVNPLKEGP